MMGLTWMQILMALFTLEQALEIAKKNGLTGVVDVSITFHPEALGLPDVTVPVAKISV